MRRLAALLTLALLAAGCSRRERLNPLDGANPETGGRPSGFNAIASFSYVRLVWTPRPDLGIDGFQLYRLVPGDSEFSPLGALLAPSSSTFIDSGTLNGRDYTYRLYYVVRGVLGARPAEDIATPGPIQGWVADPGSGTLLRISPDARDVVTSRSGLGSPYSLGVTPGGGAVWVSDPLAGTVRILDPFNFQGPVVAGLGQPFTIAIAPSDHSGWVCDLTGELHHFGTNGQPLAPGTISFLDDPGGVAVGPQDGAVWVCENGGNRVRRYSSGGIPQATGYVVGPSRVAVDSLTRFAWVTSLRNGTIHVLDENVRAVDSLSVAQGPIGIALDWRRRRAWIADAAGDQVVVVDMITRRVAFTVQGLGEARDVAVDLASGDCWVIARLDGALVRLSGAGVVRSRLAVFSDPYEVRLDPGQ